MTSTLAPILDAGGAIARRLGDKYEHRPQQLEMAEAVQQAFVEGHHLLVEAGTGVGKSFAYLLPAIDYAVKHRKRVVISTHTISLQEQLIDKDIPLIQSVYPDEFTAVLVKGRSNYLCRRRLEQTRSRQNHLFDDQQKLESLWTIEEWANTTTDGSLADLPSLPQPDVWDKVCAEHGNCLGKRCTFYEQCFWQSAKRRMAGGTILIVNHALFFSDLALRMAGVNYLPKYDLAILDEAHTIEDVAGQHFGLKVGESGVKYQLRTLYDPKRGRGVLSTHGAKANDAIRDCLELHERAERFFQRCIEWQEQFGRANGRLHEKGIVENDLSPKLKDLAKHIKAMLVDLENEAEVSELTSIAGKVEIMAQALEAILSQQMEETVYWMDVAGRTPKRVTLHAAPIDIAEGLRRHLFGKLRSVVLTSATLCTKEAKTARGMGVSPVNPAAQPPGEAQHTRHGAYLPHWTKQGAIYAVNFRLADSLPPEVVEAWRTERKHILDVAVQADRPLSRDEEDGLQLLYSERIEASLDAGHGACWLKQAKIARVVEQALNQFNGKRYRLLAWCIMPNHVHVVVQPLTGFELPQILHSWKSFTANEIRKGVDRSHIWQPEYFDHMVQDDADLLAQVDYVWRNPEKAGLKRWNWRWRISEKEDAAASVQPARGPHGRDARATEEPLSRGAGVAAVRGEKIAASPFTYIQSRLGVDEARTLQLGSPFDYSKQAILYIENDLPEPNDTLRFLPAACEKIVHYLQQTNGGAFVLFTSYKMLIDAANRLSSRLEELKLPLLVQGQGAPRRILLERFRATPNAVLFGTSSFWQGIDVQGDALRNVIIVKLPFAVPDEPLIEARLDAIRRKGGNPFMEYSVPEAIIKLKQGVGRLIRSKTDTGIVAILDSRITGKRYGQLFLDALPNCRRVVVGGEQRTVNLKDRTLSS